MSPRISVILPCYHVEEFLPNIISNFRTQTFQDIEIILVNDGGGEKQLEIMHRLKGTDDKIIIIDKPNGGLCSARNAGLEKAQGEYTIFIDPDDEVTPFYLQSLLKAIVSENADIATGGFTIHYTKENRRVDEFLEVSNLPADGDKRIEYLLSVPVVRNSMNNKMFRTQFLKENKLFFNEKLFFGEDEEYNMRCLLLTNRLVLIPESGYIYMCRDSDSICSKYSKGYKEAKELGLSLRKQVMKKIGLSDERIHQILLEDYYLLGYFVVCNLFKRCSPFSFREKVRYVSKNIFGDPNIVEGFENHKWSSDNIFTKIYRKCFSYRSPLLMVLVFQTLYGLKYRLMNLYIVLAPRLKNYKN